MTETPEPALAALDARLGALGRRLERIEEALGDLEAARARPPAGGELLAFVPRPDRYDLVPLAGFLPAPGESLEVDGERYLVSRVGRSPLPGDPRPCAYLQPP